MEQAAALAGPAGRLTLLAVTGETGAGRFRQAAISPARAQHVLDSAADIAKRVGVPVVKALADTESAAQTILEQAPSHDLLAIGAPVSGWIAGPFSGAVGDTTLTDRETPVLAARPRSEAHDSAGFPTHVLVASDGTPDSDRVVELAARIAGDHNANLTYLHAVGVESREHPAHVQAQVQALRASFDGQLAIEIEASAPRNAILAAAKQCEASLVVVGRCHRDGMRAFAGVSHRIAHEAPCSVLLSPALKRD